MIQLWMFYVFGAGFILGQLAAHSRPSMVNTWVWCLGIVLAVLLWPLLVFMAVMYGVRKAM